MTETKPRIKAKIVELAKQLGRNAAGLGDDQPIPASGYLDSAALMELITWCELEFGIEVDQDELTLDNFGTIEAMAGYIEARTP